MARPKKAVPVRALRTQAKTTGSGKVISVQTARQLTRRYRAIELRRQGYSITDIAEVLKVSYTVVREDLAFVLGEMANELKGSLDNDRALEALRFDKLTERYQSLAEAGNIAAAGISLSISDRRRKLLALDTPEKKDEGETGIRIYVGINVNDV